MADEPLAAQAAMEMLAAGGTAADAVATAYFTLAVTLPSAASLGGGGTCLVADWSAGKVVALNFVAPRSSVGGTPRATAVPANIRGMAALHARYGRLDWRMILAPAERFARFGEPLTRASAEAYASSGARLLTQAGSRMVFAPRGRLPREGEAFPQRDLADTIAQLRLNGAGSFYKGEAAEALVAAVRGAGGSLGREDLQNFTPAWQDVTGLEFGNDRAYFAPPPAGAGLVAGQMWRALVDGKRYVRADREERLHLLAAAAQIALEGRARWLADDGTQVTLDDLFSPDAVRAALADFRPDGTGTPIDGGVLAPAGSRAPASTGVVALDVLGGAIACDFTSYRPFGSGLVAPGTGVLLAPSPEPEDRNPLSLGPVMVFNARIGTFKYAAVGGDGASGPTALINTTADAVILGDRLDHVMRRPRVHNAGGGRVYLEASAGDDAVAALDARGYDVATLPSIGRVNAIHCPFGYPVEQTKLLCWAVSDPRGYGLAAFPE